MQTYEDVCLNLHQKQILDCPFVHIANLFKEITNI